MEGPCQLRIERAASGVATSSAIQCEAGGNASVLAPANAIEATLKELPHHD
jgi:hypothetical protein